MEKAGVVSDLLEELLHLVLLLLASLGLGLSSRRPSEPLARDRVELHPDGRMAREAALLAAPASGQLGQWTVLEAAGAVGEEREARHVHHAAVARVHVPHHRRVRVEEGGAERGGEHAAALVAPSLGLGLRGAQPAQQQLRRLAAPRAPQLHPQLRRPCGLGRGHAQALEAQPRPLGCRPVLQEHLRLLLVVVLVVVVVLLVVSSPSPCEGRRKREKATVAILAQDSNW